MKKCSKCKKEKGYEKFSKSAASSDGYASQCKMCRSERHASKRANSGTSKASEVGFIYCIVCNAYRRYDGKSWAKFGKSTNTDKRLRDYNSGTPFKDYRAMYNFKVKDKDRAELELHKRLRGVCTDVKGEWYEYNSVEEDKVMNILIEVAEEFK